PTPSTLPMYTLLPTPESQSRYLVLSTLRVSPSAVFLPSSLASPSPSTLPTARRSPLHSITYSPTSALRIFLLNSCNAAFASSISFASFSSLRVSSTVAISLVRKRRCDLARIKWFDCKQMRVHQSSLVTLHTMDNRSMVQDT